MTYKEWVLRLKNRNTPTGDLASDIASDKEFPTDNSREAIISHLSRKGACIEAINAFKSSWKSYQTYLKNH